VFEKLYFTSDRLVAIPIKGPCPFLNLYSERIAAWREKLLLRGEKEDCLLTAIAVLEFSIPSCGRIESWEFAA
jgi:hypothetical protein